MEDTRSRLLNAAREVFSELGYMKTRVDDIAARAGLSHGTFYRYFSDKQDILVGLTQHMAQALYGAAVAPLARPPTDPRDAVRQRLGAFFDAYAKEWDVARAWMQAEGVHATVHEVRSRVRRSIVEAIAELLARDAERGLVREGVDAGVAAAGFVAMAEGFANQRLWAGRSVGDAEIDQLADYWFRAIYGEAG